MNSNRSSKLLLVAVSFLLVAGTAGAVTISSQDTPSETRVGSRVTATYVFVDLYQNPGYERWTLRGETELENVTWTVQFVDQTGSVTRQNSSDGSAVNASVSAESGTAEVRVQLTGTVPAVEEWNYGDRQPIAFAEYRLLRQGGTSAEIDAYAVPRYTEESRQARQAIESARTAIDDAGGSQEAERTLDNAVSAYDAENFGNAVDLAEQAEGTARGAQQRSRLIRLVVLVVAGLVVIGLGVGGFYWYRSQQSQSKL